MNTRHILQIAWCVVLAHGIVAMEKKEDNQQTRKLMIPVLTPQNDLGVREIEYDILPLTMRDPITRYTMLELIEQRKEEDLPLILAGIVSQSSKHLVRHYFELYGLFSYWYPENYINPQEHRYNTSTTKIFHRNPVNNLRILEPVKIFVNQETEFNYIGSDYDLHAVSSKRKEELTLFLLANEPHSCVDGNDEKMRKRQVALLTLGFNIANEKPYDAIRYLQKMLKSEPKKEELVTTFFLLGQLYIRIGKPASCLNYFKTLLEDKDVDVDKEMKALIKLQLASLYIDGKQMGRDLAAARHYAQAVEIENVSPQTHAESLVLLADICLREGRIDEALQYASKAAKQENSKKAAMQGQYFLAKIYYKSLAFGSKCIDTAYEHLDVLKKSSAFKYGNADKFPEVLEAKLLFAKGQKEDALFALQSIIKKGKGLRVNAARLMLARYFSTERDEERAKRHLDYVFKQQDDIHAQCKAASLLCEMSFLTDNFQEALELALFLENQESYPHMKVLGKVYRLLTYLDNGNHEKASALMQDLSKEECPSKKVKFLLNMCTLEQYCQKDDMQQAQKIAKRFDMLYVQDFFSERYALVMGYYCYKLGDKQKAEEYFACAKYGSKMIQDKAGIYQVLMNKEQKNSNDNAQC